LQGFLPESWQSDDEWFEAELQNDLELAQFFWEDETVPVMDGMVDDIVEDIEEETKLQPYQMMLAETEDFIQTDFFPALTIPIIDASITMAGKEGTIYDYAINNSVDDWIDNYTISDEFMEETFHWEAFDDLVADYVPMDDLVTKVFEYGPA